MTRGNHFITLNDIELSGKRVLVRVDFNVPIQNGNILDYTRIQAHLPTIKEILRGGGKLILVSHMGRPHEGKFDESCSLLPIATALSTLIGEDVKFISNWSLINDEKNFKIILLENVRFQVGEKDNSESLSQEMASMCDIYVNDAFAAAHRSHASTHGIAKYAPIVCAGPLMVREMKALITAFKNPSYPLMAIVGGSKVSTKLEVLNSLIANVDKLIIGGGIANTFMKAAGIKIGMSLCEDSLLSTASSIMKKAKEQGKEIPLPTDVVCGKKASEDAKATIKLVEDIQEDDLILDIGPNTAKNYADALLNTKTIIWNGPLGVFELDQFSEGTKTVGHAIAKSEAFSVAGGGDTLSAISKFNISSGISYITTAGGAFLEFLEGKTLPAISILEECSLKWKATKTED